ncbi:hypothetical protein EDB86DRAFT_1842255 [Lactarius hatsudake]|nr:hypothetical protein EDB86DRAFT_1842255 [Lactarius hatsudake]
MPPAPERVLHEDAPNFLCRISVSVGWRKGTMALNRGLELSYNRCWWGELGILLLTRWTADCPRANNPHTRVAHGTRSSARLRATSRVGARPDSDLSSLPGSLGQKPAHGKSYPGSQSLDKIKSRTRLRFRISPSQNPPILVGFRERNAHRAREAQLEAQEREYVLCTWRCTKFASQRRIRKCRHCAKDIQSGDMGTTQSKRWCPPDTRSARSSSSHHLPEPLGQSDPNPIRHGAGEPGVRRRERYVRIDHSRTSVLEGASSCRYSGQTRPIRARASHV